MMCEHFVIYTKYQSHYQYLSSSTQNTLGSHGSEIVLILTLYKKNPVCQMVLCVLY